MIKRVFILLEGGNVDLSQFEFNKSDFFICADGGAKRILHDKKINVKNVLVVGDFDSIKKETVVSKGFRFLEFRKDKDVTDGEIAIDYACKKFGINVKKIIIGGITDRIDHTLCNILVLVPYVKKGHYFEIKGDKIKAYLTSKPIKFKTRINRKISLIALERVFNLKTDGLKWRLNNESIYPYKSRTLRNEAINPVVNINFNKGVLVVVET